MNQFIEMTSKPDKDKLYISLLILVFSICTVFTIWLYQKTDLEKYVDYIREYRRLHLYEKFEEASKHRFNVLSGLSGDKLNEIWLPAIQGEEDISLKLKLYLRILKTNPEREASYKEIAEIINFIEEDEEKLKYVKNLNEITDINNDYLKKYSLLKN